MPEVTTIEDLDAIKGSPWAPSGVLRDVLPDVPRPILSRDDPFVLDEERPVPRNMKITHDNIKRFGYTPGCAKCRKLSRNEYSNSSLAHSQDCRDRIETASKTDPVDRDRVQRAEQRKMDFYAKEVERSDHARRASLEPEVVHRPPTGETEIPRETEDHSSAREAKRARREPEQDLSGEIPNSSSDETLTPPEPQTETSSSTSTPIPSGASSRSGVKRTFCESTALPNSSSGASSGSGVKRSHDESFMRDDEEQPVTRARLSALIAGLHGVNAVEDDEVFTGDAVTEGWLSS